MKNNLERFVKAQAGVYETALEEMRRGRKESHWIWYIFPQLKGLGFSETAQYYGIDGMAEAKVRLYLWPGRLWRDITEAMSWRKSRRRN